jgi:hypothetical protein
MILRKLMAVLLGVSLLASCQKNDLAEAPVPLGNFALGLNIVVADNMKKVPISRPATVEEWETALIKAVDDRFGRYSGIKLYNIGIAVDGFALAPPGIPVVAAPKSVLVITANIWDDASATKLNAEGAQFTIFESFSGETVIGSGLTRSREKQMEILSYNAAKRVEQWILENPEWVGLPKLKKPTGADAPTVVSSAAPTPAPAPVPVLPPVAPPAN